MQGRTCCCRFKVTETSKTKEIIGTFENLAYGSVGQEQMLLMPNGRTISTSNTTYSYKKEEQYEKELLTPYCLTSVKE